MLPFRQHLHITRKGRSILCRTISPSSPQPQPWGRRSRHRRAAAPEIPTAAAGLRSPPGPAAGRLPQHRAGQTAQKRQGIYYTSGNYEAFARPEKPAGVEDKQAWIVGSGLAALAAACFLVRDGQMPGDHIHILETMDVAGGGL